MKILRFRAIDLLRLRAVELVPHGESVVVSGHNGQGKSSVLNAIYMALGGKDATPFEPVRHGAPHGSVFLDLGEYQVHVIIDPDRERKLRVVRKDGRPVDPPQKLLDALTKGFGFDPLAFDRMEAAKQLEALALAAGMTREDWKALGEERKRLYDDRKFANQKAKIQEGVVASLAQKVSSTTNRTPESVTALLNKVDILNKEVTANKEERERRVKLTLDFQAVDDEVRRLEAQLETTKAVREGKRILMDQAKDLPALVDPDVEAVRLQIKNAETTNELAAEARKYDEAVKQLQDEKRVADDLTAKITALEERKVKAVQAGKFAVEGLAFGEDGVTIHGITWQQCCTSDRLKASVAIAMAKNPELRVILCRDGAYLDEGNLQALLDMAKVHDFQLWIEVVDGDEEKSVVIHDGGVESLPEGFGTSHPTQPQGQPTATEEDGY